MASIAERVLAHELRKHEQLKTCKTMRAHLPRNKACAFPASMGIIWGSWGTCAERMHDCKIYSKFENTGLTATLKSVSQCQGIPSIADVSPGRFACRLCTTFGFSLPSVGKDRATRIAALQNKILATLAEDTGANITVTEALTM